MCQTDGIYWTLDFSILRLLFMFKFGITRLHKMSLKGERFISWEYTQTHPPPCKSETVTKVYKLNVLSSKRVNFE